MIDELRKALACCTGCLGIQCGARHTAAMISATPIDMETIAAVVGLCFGTRDRTQIVSTVAGSDPAAKRPATRQSTLPFLEWIAVPTVFVTAA